MKLWIVFVQERTGDNNWKQTFVSINGSTESALKSAAAARNKIGARSCSSPSQGIDPLHYVGGCSEFNRYELPPEEITTSIDADWKSMPSPWTQENAVLIAESTCDPHVSFADILNVKRSPLLDRNRITALEMKAFSGFLIPQGVIDLVVSYLSACNWIRCECGLIAKRQQDLPICFQCVTRSQLCVQCQVKHLVYKNPNFTLSVREDLLGINMARHWYRINQNRQQNGQQKGQQNGQQTGSHTFDYKCFKHGQLMYCSRHLPGDNHNDCMQCQTNACGSGTRETLELVQYHQEFECKRRPSMNCYPKASLVAEDLLWYMADWTFDPDQFVRNYAFYDPNTNQIIGSNLPTYKPNSKSKSASKSTT